MTCVRCRLNKEKSMSDSNDDRNEHAHELDHDAEHAAQQEAVARIVREGPPLPLQVPPWLS